MTSPTWQRADQVGGGGRLRGRRERCSWCVLSLSLSLSTSPFFPKSICFSSNSVPSPIKPWLYKPYYFSYICCVVSLSLGHFLYFSLPTQTVLSSLSFFFSLIYPLLPQLLPLLLLPTLLLLSRRGGQCMWPDWLDCLSRYIQQQLHIHRFRPCLVLSTLCWTQVLVILFV